MPDIEVFPDDDTEVIRVYKRYDSQSYAYTKLHLKDFARVMAKHSGLSMWRNCSDQDAMNRFSSDQKKGAARIKAKLLKDLRFRFFSPSATADHLWFVRTLR